MYENMEMRAVFGQCMESLMRSDENVCMIDADLAKANGTHGLREKFPGRCFDVGVAEANMAGVGAGLASYGFTPFISSFTAFASRRICDQVAVSIAYAGLNVKIVGADPGIAAALNGGTHMSFEDVAIMRSIPRMVVVEPADSVQLAAALPVIARHEAPAYLRLFRWVPQPVYGDGYVFDLFRADTIRAGSDVAIAASGIMVGQALLAAEELAGRGVSASVVNVHTIKPLDRKTVLAAARCAGCIVTCENHNIMGGLYSAVSEALAGENPLPVEAVGVRDQFGEVGPISYLMERYGLTAREIVRACDKAMSRK
ncbi:MAG: transketolase family protein [Planctomycetota bacterium]|jgi:transketolase|nr:transketolase family protein [Planctomycetota bacterium]